MLEGNYYVMVHRTHSEQRENKSTSCMLLSILLPLPVNISSTAYIFTSGFLLKESEEA